MKKFMYGANVEENVKMVLYEFGKDVVRLK